MCREGKIFIGMSILFTWVVTVGAEVSLYLDHGFGCDWLMLVVFMLCGDVMMSVFALAMTGYFDKRVRGEK